MSSGIVDDVMVVPAVGLAIAEVAGLAVRGAVKVAGVITENLASGISDVIAQMREENRQRLELEREWIEDLSKERDQAFNDINAYISSLNKLSESDDRLFAASGVNEAKEKAKSIINKRENVVRKIRQLREQAVKSKNVDEIEACAEQAKLLFDGLNGSLHEELVFFGKNGVKLPEYGSMHEDAVRMAITKHHDVFNVVLKTTAQDNAGQVVTESMLRYDFAVFEDSLSELLCVEGLNDRQVRDILAVKSELQKISNDDGLVPEIKKKRLATLFDIYSRRRRAILSEHKEMAEYYSQYLDVTCDIPEERIEMSDFDSLDQLAEVLEKAEADRLERLKKQYVRIQMDRVMKKHGLNVVESAVMNRKEDDKRVLYGIDDTTAVDVLISDQGTVATRVVGINFGGTPSKNDEKELVKKEHSFCSKMAAIEQDLEDLGIIMRRKKTLPPDEEFSTWIKLDETVKTDKKNINRKRKRQTGGKVMYME